MNRNTARTLGVAAALAMTTVSAATATAAPPANPGASASASCASLNPMFVVGNSMLTWKLTATVVGPGRVALSATGNVDARDLVLNQFSAQATVSWNNTTTGKYGSTMMYGHGPIPVLDRTVVSVGKGAVTLNAVVKAGAGTEWIGTKTSTPCVVTVNA
jgi:heat shock protein HslJ